MRPSALICRRGPACRVLSCLIAFVFLSTNVFYATPGFAQSIDMLHLTVVNGGR